MEAEHPLDDLGEVGVRIAHGPALDLPAPAPPRPRRNRKRKLVDDEWKTLGPLCIMVLVSTTSDAGTWDSAFDDPMCSSALVNWCTERDAMLDDTLPMPGLSHNVFVVGLAVIRSSKFLVPGESARDCPDIYEQELQHIMEAHLRKRRWDRCSKIGFCSSHFEAAAYFREPLDMGGDIATLKNNSFHFSLRKKVLQN